MIRAMRPLPRPATPQKPAANRDARGYRHRRFGEYPQGLPHLRRSLRSPYGTCEKKDPHNPRVSAASWRGKVVKIGKVGGPGTYRTDALVAGSAAGIIPPRITPRALSELRRPAIRGTASANRAPRPAHHCGSPMSPVTNEGAGR